MPEAACTSVQLHLQVTPEAFANYWNAAQAVAGVQVALGANSPFLFGKRAVARDQDRTVPAGHRHPAGELQIQGVRPRVWFGERWITSIFDLFEENVRLLPGAAAATRRRGPGGASCAAGATPSWPELRLHNGTVYRWNRPVYDVEDGRPHLRVENRVLPAGPTVVDMLANAAFYYGLRRPCSPRRSGRSGRRCRSPRPQDNLTQAARHGIDASVYWPGLGEVPVAELTLRHLLPLAREGLKRWQVDRAQAERMLTVIEERCLTGRTGATWQTETVHRLQGRNGLDRDTALREMTQRYLVLMRTGDPVHTWPVG